MGYEMYGCLAREIALHGCYQLSPTAILLFRDNEVFDIQWALRLSDSAKGSTQ